MPLCDRWYFLSVFKHCACSSIYLTFFAIIQWYKSPFARAHFGTIFNEKPLDASQIFFLGKWRHRDLILFLAPFNCLMQCVSSVWRRRCTAFENIQKISHYNEPNFLGTNLFFRLFNHVNFSRGFLHLKAFSELWFSPK